MVPVFELASLTRLHVLPFVQYQVVLLRKTFTTLLTAERFKFTSTVGVPDKMLIKAVLLSEAAIAIGACVVFLVEVY